MQNTKLDPSARLLLSLACSALMVFAVPSVAQEQVQKTSILALSIAVAGDGCVGENVVMTAELRNVSKKPVAINRAYLWRYGSEKALDRHSSPLLKIPEMRAHTGDSFDSPDDFLTLKPGEAYERSRIIDTKSDQFYRSAGKYAIKIGYGQFARSRSLGKTLFVGGVWSNEVVFTIKECGEQEKPGSGPR